MGIAVATRRLSDVCPASPEGVHVWGLFETGYGCHLCPAFVTLRTITATDPLIEQHPAEMLPLTHVYEEPIYLGLDQYEERDVAELMTLVMADLLEVAEAGEAITYAQLETIATRIVTRVREDWALGR